MRTIVALIIAILVWSAPAPAAEQPAVSPAPSWVEAMPIPAADPALKERPLQMLLVDGQSRYGKDGMHDYFFEYATLVQTPQGLAGMGNLEFAWQPGLSELLIHRVQILRAGKVIDLLPRDGVFTVLRRENNLEGAVLNGTLTAVLQPEGLSLGDIVNVAWTLRVKPMAATPGAENLMSLSRGLAVRRLRFRETWEDGVAMRWRATEAMGKPRLRRKDGINELTLELDDAQGPEPPKGAPPRFNLPATLEISSYSGWPEISRLMAPLYAQAQAIAPASPLKAEIARIAAAGTDPRVRTMAALRLVQDKIRYFALTMGQGGYVPATADQTWQRRFGDCKGKTVTLLALLAGLGIEAEPVLVSNVFGDSLQQRLPLVRLFDHVIVRARIGGRSYWLDGTRTGDRSLDALASSPFGFGLPVRAAGADLEALPLEPPASPLSDISIRYDATGGFDQLVPFTLEAVFRGDLATAWRNALAAQGEAAVLEALKPQMPAIPDEDLVLKSVRDDEASGELRFSFAGKTRMGWNPGPGGGPLRFQFDDSVIQWAPDFERKPGPGSDAPFELAFPYHLRLEEAIALPRGGTGFTLDSRPLDESVAATRIVRAATLKGNQAVAVSTFRRLAAEVAAAETKAAEPVLDRVNRSRAFVVAPAGYKMSEAERAAMRAETPRDAREYVDRGFRLLGDGGVKAALADFDKAIELDRAYARAHSHRGLALVQLNRLDEAEAALQRAREFEETDFVVHQGLGVLHLARDRPTEAVDALTRAIQLAPDNRFALNARATAYGQLGKFREALADIDRLIGLEPKVQEMLWEKARLHAALGEAKEALAAHDRLMAIGDERWQVMGSRGELLNRLGRTEEAIASWRQSLALVDARLKASAGAEGEFLPLKMSFLMLTRDFKGAVAVADSWLRRYPDNVRYLAMRCHARADGAIELALAKKDCDDAIRFDSGSVVALNARALINLRLGQWDRAIADYDAALALEPRNFRSLFGRGVARLRKGEREAGGAGPGQGQTLQLRRRRGVSTRRRRALRGSFQAFIPPFPTSIDMADLPKG